MSNVTIQQVEGGQIGKPSTTMAIEVDDGSTSYYILISDILNKIPVSGGMLNGSISVTVASNNITLALKTLAGTDASAADPIYININGTVRTITGALSVTVNAGTNTFNAGSAELATKAIDYFAYLSWRALSNAVVIGFGRIPWARLYSNFSGTATNEAYGAFSTAPAATDDVCLIGRFEATLSAGAGYTWTVPTFTNANLIQHPIFETRWLTYTPVWTSTGTQPSLGNGTIAGQYRVRATSVAVLTYLKAGSTSTFGTGQYRLSIPLAAVAAANLQILGGGRIEDSGTAFLTAICSVSSSILTFFSPSTGGSAAAEWAATYPMTWAQNDAAWGTSEYPIA